ncbi:MAG: hydroxypyruvate isomerase [Pseudooceanicola sp.]|jgi:hydroxypyruvate isomerase|nr:hydroxypyruvate isomerase [Pseudooceanicola sp.]|tara:strand:- start:26 stop:787 length:762 start_codon:yes stop_codon:yes gene_type:complete
MLRFSANLSMLFTELPFEDRFRAAAAAGFEAVEIPSPYDGAARDIRRALLSNGLSLSQIGAPPPNYTGGRPGYAGEPESEARFQGDMRRAMRVAAELSPEIVHIAVGNAEVAEAEERLVTNLRWAAQQWPGQVFVVSPLNAREHPGCALPDYDTTARVLDKVGFTNMGLQFDTYHAAMITGDAVAVWTAHKALIRYVQVADMPRRTEPGAGRIDFPSLFTAMQADGYKGWIAAEYLPTTRSSTDSLTWRPELA